MAKRKLLSKEAIHKFVRTDLFYIIIIFLATRVLLMGFALLARKVFLGPDQFQLQNWLDIFKIWDSEHYLDIAENGYSATKRTSIGAANYAFFPLYPMMIRVLSWFTRSVQISAILISNIAAFLSALYLFRLVKETLDEKLAKRSIKFLFIAPASFILASIFSESLFLLLLILAFYFANKKQWWKVGITGFFLALTRSLGVWMVIPLFIEYLHQHRKDIKITFNNLKQHKNVLWLGLFPVGLLIFIIFNWNLTGDALAFVHIQEAWGHEYSNPFTLLFKGLTSFDERTFVNSVFAFLSLVLITINYKKLKPSYLVLSYILIIMPMTTGLVSLYNMIRYILPIFPIYILLAKLSTNKKTEELITISLSIIVGALVIFWALEKIII